MTVHHAVRTTPIPIQLRSASARKRSLETDLDPGGNDENPRNILSVRRWLEAPPRRPQEDQSSEEELLSAERTEEAYAPFTPANVTEAVNSALEDDQPEFALRLITHAASILGRYPDKFSPAAIAHRPVEVIDPRWEQLFRVLIGDAVPADQLRPPWTETSKLDDPWYPFCDYISLRRRADDTTPARLRALNIMLDARSLRLPSDL